MRVVSIAAECEPWAKTGGLGDVVDALARALGQVGAVSQPVDVYLPRYASVPVPDDARSRPLRVADPRPRRRPLDLAIVDVAADGYRLRLVDHPPAFDRPELYGYDDDAWRFAVLSAAALQAMADEGDPIDVIHIHDWHTGPVPIFRATRFAADPVIGRASVVLTIHNLAYQGWVPAGQLTDIGLRRGDGFVARGAAGVNLLWTGIDLADRVNTVSPTFARESLTPAFGFGLESVLAARGARYSGILNGLDTQLWDPATDSTLAARYRVSAMAGKARARSDLLERLAMDPADRGLVAGAIGRFDPQKGFDLIAGSAPAVLESGVRLIVQGTGWDEVARPLRRLARRAKGRVALIERFDRDMARRIYAGSDVFLMPSRFEPCGQGQMIAMRYGTPPVVHRTGGLADTVLDETNHPGSGTGFVFDHPTAEGLAWAIGRAASLRGAGRTRAWRSLVARAMAVDHDWRTGAAPGYANLYRRAIRDRRRAPYTAARQPRARRRATSSASG